MGVDKLLVKGTTPPQLDRELTVIGKPINRLDGYEKVTGNAWYTGDLRIPGLLHGKILLCPHTRARIVKIDVSKAEELQGVKAVLTKDNTKGWLTYWYNVPQIALPECITYEGQEVAVVAAEDIDTAQKAIGLIEVEYEILPPMTDADEALTRPPPPIIADENYPLRDNIDRKPCLIKRGDVEKGFAESDVVVEETYTTPTQCHATIQTRVCVANWDGQQLTVWDSTQGVWNSKGALAKSLGLEPDKVRVIVKYLGGGFGSKAWAQRISYYAAKLSMATGRPVKIERTRREEFLAHSHRFDCKFIIKMGAKWDGTIIAIYEKAVLNIGAVSRYDPMSIIWQTSNLYACPNVHLEQIGVFTNRGTTGPLRAPYNMPSNFALESHIDRMADALGLDPLQFRLKNYATYPKTHMKPELKDKEMKLAFSSNKLDECMKKVTEAIGWERRKGGREASRGTKKRGIGMASFVAHQGGGNYPNNANADVSINHDGVIRLYAGVVDIGGGQKTIFSMIAAEELGVAVDNINMIYGDTRDTRYAPSAHSSRCTAEMGPPVLKAASEARQKLFEVAAKTLGVNAGELQSKNGDIYIKSDPSRSISFKKACLGIEPDNPIWGSGSREANPEDTLFSSFGAQAAEVEVDTETGEVNVVKIAVAQDFGKVLNPKLCTSQVYGGIEIGVGYALTEEGVYDKKTGKMLNSNFHEYKIPCSLDIPIIEPFFVESEDPGFAYSARGGAEVVNTPTPAAIRNAIYNAIGVWFNDLPITPDKIVNAAQAKKEKVV
jgi:xanthine dehydrogenase YagR molybdenum-binding subunit